MSIINLHYGINVNSTSLASSLRRLVIRHPYNVQVYFYDRQTTFIKMCLLPYSGFKYIDFET